VTGSQTDPSVDGPNHGIQLKLTSKVGESKIYILPQISIHDKHEFVFAALDEQLVEVDKVNNLVFDKEFVPCQYVIPSGTDNYRLSFNVRCAPDYLNNTNLYTLYYENGNDLPVSNPISGRLSTPLLKNWWVVGVPTDTQHLPFGWSQTNHLSPRDDHGYPDNLSAGTPHPDAFKNYHVPKRFESVSNVWSASMTKAYLDEDSVRALLSHVEAARDSHAGYNTGAVWNSGTCTPASGYVDITSGAFGYTFGNFVLTSGMIPNGTYSIFLIVKDTLEHYTGVDLLYLQGLNHVGYGLKKSDFNY
jgi:hypothetical protein